MTERDLERAAKQHRKAQRSLAAWDRLLRRQSLGTRDMTGHKRPGMAKATPKNNGKVAMKAHRPYSGSKGAR